MWWVAGRGRRWRYPRWGIGFPLWRWHRRWW